MKEYIYAVKLPLEQPDRWFELCRCQNVAALHAVIDAICQPQAQIQATVIQIEVHIGETYRG